MREEVDSFSIIFIFTLHFSIHSNFKQLTFPSLITSSLDTVIDHHIINTNIGMLIGLTSTCIHEFERLNSANTCDE